MQGSDKSNVSHDDGGTVGLEGPRSGRHMKLVYMRYF